MIKWIGQHIVDLIARFRSDVYLESISSGTIASGGNLGLDSNNKIVKDSGVGATDLHGAGVDGAANQLLTDDGDGTVTSESTLSYNSETLTIGADDNGQATIKRMTHSDDEGGDLYIRGGDATGTNKAGGGVRLYTGKSTGNESGGNVGIYGVPAGSSGSSVNGVYTDQAIALFKSDMSTTLGGNLIFEGASPDAHETTFSITDPTGDRTVTVPDADVDLTKVRAASTTLDGVVELATTAEADTGTDTARAITAAGLKSHVDARFSYQYIPLSMNITGSGAGNWEYASGNGIGNHLYNQDGGAGGTTASNTDGTASTISIHQYQVSGGIIVPYDCVLVGFYGHTRSNDNSARALGLFTGTQNWNTLTPVTAYLRAHAQNDTSAVGGDDHYSIRPFEHSVLDVNLSMNAGQCIWMCARDPAGAGGGMIASVTIVLKTLMP